MLPALRSSWERDDRLIIIGSDLYSSASNQYLRSILVLFKLLSLNPYVSSVVTRDLADVRFSGRINFRNASRHTYIYLRQVTAAITGTILFKHSYIHTIFVTRYITLASSPIYIRSLRFESTTVRHATFSIDPGYLNISRFLERHFVCVSRARSLDFPNVCIPSAADTRGYLRTLS